MRFRKKRHARSIQGRVIRISSLRLIGKGTHVNAPRFEIKVVRTRNIFFSFLFFFLLPNLCIRIYHFIRTKKTILLRTDAKLHTIRITYNVYTCSIMRNFSKIIRFNKIIIIFIVVINEIIWQMAFETTQIFHTKNKQPNVCN